MILAVGYRSIRFSSVLCFTSATIVGAVLSGSLFNFGMVWLLIFSASSTAFAFVINDLSDGELDKSSGVLRNPISTGELSFGKCVLIALGLLLMSSAALLFSSPYNQLFGLVIIFLYFTYSWFVRAKARPVLDVVYHGLCPAILATMGYMEYKPFDVTCLLLASMVFLLSAVSQILQEFRDYETDRKAISTTVTLLGKRTSLFLSLAFFTTAFVICLLLLFIGVIPPEIMLLSPLAFFIVYPIIRAIRNEEYENKMLREIREKRLILIAILVTTLVLRSILSLA